ncbi:hypothetical protein D3C77_567520 [compost metagenome]
MEFTEAGILSTAFLNPDGTIAVVVMNESEELRSFTLGLEDEVLEVQLESHSIITYVIE